MPRTKPRRTISVAMTVSIAMSIGSVVDAAAGETADVAGDDVKEEVAALRVCNAECSWAE